MFLKQILVSSAAAFLLAATGSALAEQQATPLVSGDEPMNVEDAAEVKAPDPSAKAQAKTEKMLKEEAGIIGGDTNPVDEADAGQLKAPDSSAKAQAKTEKMLKKADDEAGAISGKYE